MKNIIHHVNSKPEHIRQLVALGCTVAIGSLVFAFWFHSFQNTTYALLNPGQEQNGSSQFALGSNSLFGYIGSTFSDLKAQVGALFGGPTSIQTEVQQQPTGPVYPLPISDNR